jgi:hypothetical protein
MTADKCPTNKSSILMSDGIGFQISASKMAMFVHFTTQRVAANENFLF